MIYSKKRVVALAACFPLLTACVTPGEDDPNAATKQGAAGGALLGLTLGALTGDAELAMKGAVAGGVAGGVSGASVDIQNNRENSRSQSRDDAIASIGSENSSKQTPAHWQQLDNFVGNWQVTIQNHAQNLQGIDPVEAKGSLNSTSEASVALSNSQGIDITANFSYEKEAGYQMVLTNNAKDIEVTFTGEQAGQENQYNFYPTNPNDVIYEGVSSGNIRAELRFAGKDIWIIESYVYADGKETRVQSFRFNRI